MKDEPILPAAVEYVHKHASRYHGGWFCFYKPALRYHHCIKAPTRGALIAAISRRMREDIAEEWRRRINT